MNSTGSWRISFWKLFLLKRQQAKSKDGGKRKVRTKVEYGEKNEEYILQNMNPYVFNRPKTLEQLYYRDIFEKLFPKIGIEKIIPYFWMPNFVKNATDASARTLNVYKEKIKNND